MSIQLRWVKAYPAESKNKVETGLNWALSFLGADLPADSADVYRWQGNVLTLDLDAAGVMAASRPAWIAVLSALKRSDEYRKIGAMDIGRFVLLTLCSSPQYFALTGTAKSFADFNALHATKTKPAAVVESAIAHGNRLLEISQADRFQDVFFLAYEGTGSLVDGSFKKEEIEALDFMPNGQLRFALYNLDGSPKEAATAALTDAGKPSKCLWCHEIRLQRPFNNRTSVPGYYSAQELSELIQQRMQIVDSYRRQLPRSRIDFTRLNDHTYAELLYLSFAEPSAARLSLEWNMPEERVKRLLAGNRTHAEKEFAAFGSELYDREEVDRFAPYQTFRGPSHWREASAYEPNLVGPQDEIDTAPPSATQTNAPAQTAPAR